MLKPIGNKILVEKVDPGVTETSSGIYLEASTLGTTQEGQVVAIGQIAEKIKVGDTVIYNINFGQPVSLEGREYLILETNQVLAIKEKNEK